MKGNVLDVLIETERKGKRGLVEDRSEPDEDFGRKVLRRKISSCAGDHFKTISRYVAR